ncbi:MAG: DNA primase [Eubacteriaceae bacterium]|jgi:DNA primase
MPRYSQETINRIKEACDIVDVISGYTELKQKGSSFMGCCPFHSEKTPSFSVSREKQLYHCFGCGEGGTLVDFIMKAENLTFPEAMRFLAERAGIPLPEAEQESAEERRAYSQKKAIYEMNRLAANYFYKNLRHSEKAQEYLRKRGMSDQTIRELGVGLAPEDWRRLITALRRQGFSQEDIEASGLAVRGKNGSVYDRFRNRIMFPIQNGQDRLIGFGGRKWTDSDNGPKYLNSPETPVFEKGQELYNLNRARKNIRSRGYLLLVEGYMDAAALWQYGIKNAAAALGTAFTLEHAALIKRVTDQVVLCFDGDAAGEAATAKALDILEKTTLKLRVLRLPPEHDPDSFIRENGTEAFEEALEHQTMTPEEFHLRQAAAGKDLKTADGKLAYISEAVKLLQKADPVKADLYIRRIAGETDTPEEVISNAVKSGETVKLTSIVRIPKRKTRRSYVDAQVSFMAVSLHDPSRFAESGLKRENFSPGFFQWLYDKIQKQETSQPIQADLLFDCDEDMRYNKKTSVIMTEPYDKASEYFDQSIQIIQKESIRTEIEKLKELRKNTRDEEERNACAAKISELLKQQ